MGIDAHAINLLDHARKRRGDLGNTVTLGRMVVHLGPRARRRWTGAPATVGTVYGESLLAGHFGATRVDAIDNSDYEGATIVADLNHPLPPRHLGAYDSVLDFGCMEHIFDARQALRNITGLCRIGGMILHVLPANGYCGHGFYQYSPELFFSYYTPRNGFGHTEVFLADPLDPRYWYKVAPPAAGRRVNVRSGSELLVIVCTQRVAEVADFAIQQSDYVHEWESPSAATPDPAPAASVPPRWRAARAAIREWLFGVPLLARAAHELDSAFSPVAPKRLGRRNPDLVRIRMGGH